MPVPSKATDLGLSRYRGLARSGRRVHGTFGDASGTPGRRAARTVALVLVSYVVRLLPRQLAEGEFVGQVEDVASGERVPVQSAEDLLQFLSRSVRSDGGHGG